MDRIAKSRRGFLQTSAIAFASLSVEANAQERVEAGTAATAGEASRDYWNDLPNYLTKRVNQARGQRKSALASVRSPAQATARAAMVREKVWELIGGKPETSPLNAKVTGVIERADYRIEKVIFESQPEFYVPAHLYLPKGRTKPCPGILAPVGHASEGKTYQSYQTLFQNLARRGYAVLTWDPPGQGERFQYIDPDKKRSLFGATGEHDRFGWPALLIGSTTTQFEAWDGIRALDYLVSRPEVDSGKIGCCGHSGGGTQTMFLCALEPRIQAAVVVEGHTENLAGADYQPPGAYADAEQNMIGGLKHALDRGDLLYAFAPKPLLICYTPIDAGTTYSPHYVEGNREIFAELSAVYGVHGAKEKVALSSSTLPHDYDYFHRQSTYRWFGRWFPEGEHSGDEIAFEDAPESSLWCTTTGQVLTSLGGRAAFQVNYDRLRSYKQNSKSTSADELQTELRQVLDLPHQKSPLRVKALSTRRLQNVSIEEFQYESEPGIRVPGWFLKPEAAAAKLPVVLMVSDGGKDALFDRWSLVERFAGAQMAVCSIDVRTVGVTTPDFPAAGPRFYGNSVEEAYALVNLSAGFPIIGQQVWDVLRCLDYLESRKDVNVQRLAVSGNGICGLPCLMAAGLDSRVHALLLNDTIATLASVVESKSYELPVSAVAFGILQKFDLPDLCASLVPRAVWMVNMKGPQQEPMPLAAVREKYKGAEAAYLSAGNAPKLVFRAKPDSDDQMILEWSQQTLA